MQIEAPSVKLACYCEKLTGCIFYNLLHHGVHRQTKRSVEFAHLSLEKVLLSVGLLIVKDINPL